MLSRQRGQEDNIKNCGHSPGSRLMSQGRTGQA
jgi:hypothetical protein